MLLLGLADADGTLSPSFISFFASLSSGGSDRGLEVLVKGLEGALASPAFVTVALRRDNLLGVCPFNAFDGVSRVPGAGVGNVRARSQKCS